MIVLYVGTQLIAGLITSIGGDKTQQRIMLALPFVFVIFIINFEAGLIVYWITTNVWTIGQQLVVRKLYPRPDLSTADQEPDDKPPPARGKPRPAGAKPARAGAAVAAGKAGGSANGGTPKAPPGSPRKKKKRSGRRR